MPVGAPLILYKGNVFYAPARDLCEDFAPRDGTIRPSGDGGANRASENRPVLLALDSSQVFDFSSRGTTLLDPKGSSFGWTWCFTRVKALILRRGVPRRWVSVAHRSPAGLSRAAPTMMKRCVPMPPVDGSGSGSFGVNSQVPVNFTFPSPAGSFGSKAVTSSGSSLSAVRLLNSY